MNEVIKNGIKRQIMFVLDNNYPKGLSSEELAVKAPTKKRYAAEMAVALEELRKEDKIEFIMRLKT